MAGEEKLEEVEISEQTKSLGKKMRKISAANGNVNDSFAQTEDINTVTSEGRGATSLGWSAGVSKSDKDQGLHLSKVNARSNFADTAFF